MCSDARSDIITRQIVYCARCGREAYAEGMKRQLREMLASLGWRNTRAEGYVCQDCLHPEINARLRAMTCRNCGMRLGRSALGFEHDEETCFLVNWPEGQEVPRT